MKLNTLMGSVAALTMGAALVACNQEQSAAPDHQEASSEQEAALTTQQQRISYLVGHNFARQWSSQGLHLDSAAVALAISDVAAEKERLSEEEIKQTIETFRQDQLALQEQQAQQAAEARELAEAEFNKQAAQNLAEGAAFLAENAQQEGVVTTDSGLQYKVLASGSGASPKATDTVEVHYVGTLLDGTEFDSSLKRGVPASFQLNQVIAGWTEALQLMQEGDKWQLFIPAELAYQSGGTGPIGPNATLQFEVELLKVTRNEPAEQE